MSIALMTQVWKTDMPSGRKLVLLSLCDNANDQGECYPSVSMIAQRCSMSERAVQGHIKDLTVAGIVSRLDRKGRSTVYQISLENRGSTPAESAPPQNLRPAESAPHPRRICTPADFAPPQNLHPTPADSAPTPADSAPITINESSITVKEEKDPPPKKPDRPESVPEQVWADFLTHRRSKKAPVTQTALNGIRREAVKAGLSLADALQKIIERDWRGFDADWLKAPAVKTAEGDNRLAKLAAAFSEELPELPTPAISAWTASDLADFADCWAFVQAKGKTPEGVLIGGDEEQAIEWFRRLFRHIRGNDWLMGRTDKWDGITLAWLMNPENRRKAIESRSREAA